MGFLSSVPPAGGDIADVTRIINGSRIPNYTKEDKSKFIIEIRKWLGKNKGGEKQISCSDAKWSEFGRAIVKIVKGSPEALGTIVSIEDIANRRFGNLPPELQYYTFVGPDGDQKSILVKQIEALNSEALKAAFGLGLKEKEERSINFEKMLPEAFLAVTDFLETGLSDEEKIAEVLEEVFDFAVQYNLEELLRGCWDLIESAYSEAVKSGNEEEISRLKKFIQEIKDAYSEDPLVKKTIGGKIENCFFDSSKYPNFFGKEQWKHHFGEVGDVPPFPENIETILDSPCSIWEGKKVSETHTLLLMPATVNGKLLSLDSLQKLANSPRDGNKTLYQYYDSAVQSGYGRKSVCVPYWVLITNDVLPESRGKSFEEQEKMVKDLDRGADADYQVLWGLEAVALNIAVYVSKEKRLYGDEPWTYTRCQEKIKDKWPLVVGGLTPLGDLYVGYGSFDVVCCGAAACRKRWLSAIGT